AAQAEGDQWRESDIWHEYGYSLLLLKRYEEAQAALETALEMTRSLEFDADPEVRHYQLLQESVILQHLADIYQEYGDPFGREFLEREARRPLRPESYYAVLRNLVSAYIGTRSNTLSERAIEVGQEWVELNRQMRGPGEVVEALRFSSWILSFYDLPRAVAVGEEALELAKTLDNPTPRQSVATVGRDLAQSLHAEGEVEGAIAILHDTIAYLRQHEPDDHWNLFHLTKTQAEYHRDIEQYPQAVQLNQENLALAQQPTAPLPYHQQFQTLEALSELAFLQENLTQALDYQQQALGQIEQYLADYQQQNSTHEIEAFQASFPSNSHLRLGFLHLQLRQLAEAEHHLLEALKFDNQYLSFIIASTDFSQHGSGRDEGTVNTFEPGAEIYRLLHHVYLQQGRLKDALLASERGRARSTLLFAKTKPDEDLKLTDSKVTFKELKAIARREKTTIVQYSLVYKYPHYWRKYRGKFARRDITDLIIWAVTPQGDLVQQTVALDEQAVELERLIRTMRRRLISNAQSNRAAPMLQTLHSLLIAPIQDYLPTDPEQRVTFIADGDLFLVPFAALQDANGQELIEQHTILTAPSIQLLEASRRNAQDNRPSQPALIIGNPTMPEVPDAPDLFNRSSLAPLPGAEAEAKAIAALLKAEPLIRDAATEKRVTAAMPAAEILHFATHGLLEYSSYANSLALAPTADEDGFLSVREITQLDLNAKLAVLSACDTGRGELYNGEGVLGLSRAFIGAGAASVLVSLWAIPDQPTAALMTEFYRRRAAGEDNAAALRNAMLVTREQFPAPGNWAAFTITGAVD
ncbi:MAG: CHAT domain-containing protein, partial [Spirulina sp. SIO3F2]|nr:CHAT domain-containing protein [Spirulina sp. SIO3F2]